MERLIRCCIKHLIPIIALHKVFYYFAYLICSNPFNSIEEHPEVITGMFHRKFYQNLTNKLLSILLGAAVI